MLSLGFQGVVHRIKQPSGDERVNRLVNSMSDDAQFVRTRARTSPGKHLNRFRHYSSYHTAGALETELTTDISDRNCATPDGITKLVGLCTSAVWDTYD